MRILELDLYSDTLDATGIFYSNILELPLVSSDRDAISFYTGSSILRFRKSVAMRPAYHFAFNVPRQQFHRAFQRLDKVLSILKIHESTKIADFPAWKARAFYFLDNNENIVECIARDELAEDKIVGNEIVSISEIGIVCEDPGQLQIKLTRNLGLPIFSRQAPKENFIAVGSDEGLFILVSKERPWYPTQILSQPFPGKVSISLNGSDYELDFSLL